MKKNTVFPLFWRSMLVLGLFAGLWELAARLELISTIFFPAPSIVLQALFKFFVSGKIFEHLAVSLTRITAGAFLGVALGLPLGLLMGWRPAVRMIFDPLVAAFHPIPKIAIFPILLIIFGIGESAILVAIAISAFFPVVINSMTGVREIDPVYFEVAKNYGANRLKTITRVLLPGSLPMLLSGIRLSVNTALLMTVAVELVSAKQGLGVLLWLSWQTLRVEELYATLTVIAVLGALFNAGLKYLNLLWVPWAQDKTLPE